MLFSSMVRLGLGIGLELVSGSFGWLVVMHIFVLLYLVIVPNPYILGEVGTNNPFRKWLAPELRPKMVLQTIFVFCFEIVSFHSNTIY